MICVLLFCFVAAQHDNKYESSPHSLNAGNGTRAVLWSTSRAVLWSTTLTSSPRFSRAVLWSTSRARHQPAALAGPQCRSWAEELRTLTVRLSLSAASNVVLHPGQPCAVLLQRSCQCAMQASLRRAHLLKKSLI